MCMYTKHKRNLNKDKELKTHSKCTLTRARVCLTTIIPKCNCAAPENIIDFFFTLHFSPQGKIVSEFPPTISGFPPKARRGKD